MTNVEYASRPDVEGGPRPTTPRIDTSLAWTAIVDPPQGGARNMAVDEALARTVSPGCAMLRLYLWSCPTLSFGRNEPAAGRFDEPLARRLGVAFVRRPTGGRAVLHHRELTYSVAVPVGAIGGLRDTYRRINEALLISLGAAGASVRLATDKGETAGPSAGPCFDTPAAGELVSGGRKLVGSAQVRIGRVILQHGSIILDGTQDLVARLGGAGQARPPATLRDLLGSEPELGELRRLVIDGFRTRFGGDWSEGGLGAHERDLVARLEPRYRSREWTWRR